MDSNRYGQKESISGFIKTGLALGIMAVAGGLLFLLRKLIQRRLAGRSEGDVSQLFLTLVLTFSAFSVGTTLLPAL